MSDREDRKPDPAPQNEAAQFEGGELLQQQEQLKTELIQEMGKSELPFPPTLNPLFLESCGQQSRSIGNEVKRSKYHEEMFALLQRMQSTGRLNMTQCFVVTFRMMLCDVSCLAST